MNAQGNTAEPGNESEACRGSVIYSNGSQVRFVTVQAGFVDLAGVIVDRAIVYDTAGHRAYVEASRRAARRNGDVVVVAEAM